MKRILSAVASTALLLVLTSISGFAQDLGEIEKRFAAVSKVVSDPLSDEAAIRKSLRELEKLARATREIEEGDLRPGSSGARLVKEVAGTLKLVRSRLPAELASETPARPGFPVPQFDGKELLADRASVLHGAQQQLASHLRKGGKPGKQSDALLHEVTKAQEDLAWEAGWPFTKKEADEVRKAGRLTEGAYASRLERGIRRINQQIKSEIDSNGREHGRPFVISHPTTADGKKKLAQHLEKLRQVGGLPTGLVREFDAKEAEVLKGAEAPKKAR